jgi:hypothetical protein
MLKLIIIELTHDYFFWLWNFFGGGVWIYLIFLFVNFFVDSVFAGLIIVAEVRFRALLKNFQFLQTYLGRGIFYIL